MMTPARFEALVAPYRRELAAHCYRMLGSVHDAEDQVQETLLSAWRGIDGFEGRASMRSWLYTIATNRCLDAIRRRPRQGMPYQHGAPRDPTAPLEPAGERLWVEPCPPDLVEVSVEPSAEVRYSSRQSVQLAFIVALQQLPATQRAAVLLRDVLGWSAAEVAQLLDTSVAAVNSALQRARATLADHDSREPMASSELEALAARYTAAWLGGDLDAFVALLHEDVIVSMPPTPSWLRGREAAREFFTSRIPSDCTRHLIRIAGTADTLVFASYRTGEAGLVAFGVQVLQAASGKLVELHSFLDRALVQRFGMPDTIVR